MPFYNREEAGRMLAKRLLERELDHNPIIIALPRGGVPVGFEIAKVLRYPLDILVVRKIGAPGNPEYGIGAMTEDNEFLVDQERATNAGASEEDLKNSILHEGEEILRRSKLYRGNNSKIPVKGRTVILVDDGIATGVTVRAAIHYLKSQGALRIVVASPVCSSRAAALLRTEVDEVLNLIETENFVSVGQFYADFNQVTDEEVMSCLSQARKSSLEEKSKELISQEVKISEGRLGLPGLLTLPPEARGMIIFAHGSGSSRLSPRNQQVAQILNQSGFGTLLFDLMTEEESENRANVFNIPFLGDRLIFATRWLKKREEIADLHLGYFGASTGAAAALWAAASLGTEISAIVSRGGRPDLAMSVIPKVPAPTLLIVGGVDKRVLAMNQEALRMMKSGELVTIPGATHLFEEQGALERVAEYAVDWFKKNLAVTDKKNKREVA